MHVLGYVGGSMHALTYIGCSTARNGTLCDHNSHTLPALPSPRPCDARVPQASERKEFRESQRLQDLRTALPNNRDMVPAVVAELTRAAQRAPEESKRISALCHTLENPPVRGLRELDVEVEVNNIKQNPQYSLAALQEGVYVIGMKDQFNVHDLPNHPLASEIQYIADEVGFILYDRTDKAPARRPAAHAAAAARGNSTAAATSLVEAIANASNPAPMVRSVAFCVTCCAAPAVATAAAPECAEALSADR